MRDMFIEVISTGSDSRPRGSRVGACNRLRLVISVTLVLGASMERRAAAQDKPVNEAHTAALDEAKELDKKVEEYYAKGQYDAALPLAEKALQTYERALGPDHLDVAEAMNTVATLHYARGLYDQALPLYERTLAIREKALGKHHPDVARALNSLGLLQKQRGELHQALPLFERSLAIRERALGEHHLDVAMTLNNLGSLHQDRGDYERALPLFERSVAIYEKSLGEHHLKVALPLSNLGTLYHAKGDHERAVPLLERALAIREQALGAHHPDVANSLSNLGSMHQARGDYDQALPLLERSLAIVEQALGKHHPVVGFPLNNLAGLHNDKGDYERALPLFERALSIWEKALGKEHPKVATALNNLAMIYHRKGDYEQALPLLERSLAIREKALGEHHPSVAISLTNLAQLHDSKGDHERSLPLHERALAIREKALGEHHPEVGNALNSLAWLYQTKGDYERALALYERSLAIQENVMGKHHPDVAVVLNNTAWSYESKGDHEQALLLYERALAINEKAFGKHHPRVATSLNNVAMMYKDKGNYERALPLLERSLAIKKKALDKHNPDVAESLNNLAAIHWAQGNHDLSLRYRRSAMDIRETHIALASASDSARAKRLFLTVYSREVDIVVSLALDYDRPEASRLALATLLSRKGRVLDSTSDAFAAVRRHLGPDEQKLLDEYRANRTLYARQLLRGPERIPEDQHRKNLAALERRGNELERLIAARSNEFRGQLRSVTPKAVQAALREGTALVEWVRYRPFDPRAPRYNAFGAEHYAASILDKSGDPIWLDLGEAKPIDAAIAAWRSALARQLATTNELARELDALVMAPVRARLGNATNLFLAPDGPLHLVPFAALVDEQGQHLVRRYSFTYLTSGRDLLRLHDRKDAIAQSPPLIMADPKYPISGHPDSQQFMPLPQVMAEARAVQSFFPDATLLSGAQATEAALKQARGPAIVHIATHGYFMPMTCGASDADADDASLQSGLALAGANACQSPATNDADATSDDGLLTALEAASLDLHGTELAVLSACDTGIGATELRDDFMDRNIGRGEGVYGLRRALVLAGARTQMVSLWRVDDAVTRQLMTTYYRKLASGVGRAEALRQVQLELLASKEFSLPYYWASFIVSGDPAPLPQKVTSTIPPVQRGARGCACDASPAQGSPAWPGSALLAIIALGMLRRMRRRNCTRPPGHRQGVASTGTQ